MEGGRGGIKKELRKGKERGRGKREERERERKGKEEGREREKGRQDTHYVVVLLPLRDPCTHT